MGYAAVMMAFHIKEEIIEFEDENESNLNESQFNPGWNFTVKNEGHSQNITETAHYFDVIRFKKEKGKEDEAYLPYSNEVEEEGEACSSYANEENALQKLGTSKDFCEFNEETQRFPQFKYRKRRYVGEKSKKFKCNLCSYEGHTLALLRRHRLNHFAEKRFQCSQCDFRAYFQSYVTVHEVVHAKTKKSLYKCSNCSFVAKFRKSFITHCRKHLREKGPTKRISQNTYTRKKRTCKRKLEKANENVIVKERYSKRLKRLRKEKDISDSEISFDIDDNDSKEKSRTGIRQSGKRGRTRKNPNDSNSVISLVRDDDDIKEKSLRNDPRSRNKRIGKNKDDAEISFQMGNGNYLGHHDPQSDKRRTRKKNNDPGLKISSSNDDDLKEELPVYNDPRFRKENDSDSVSFHKNDSKEESGHEVLQSLKKRNSPKKKSDSDSKFSQYFADDSKEESGHGLQSDKKRTSKKQSDSDSEFPFNIDDDDDEDSRQDDIRKSTTKIENRKTVRRKLRRDQSKDAIHLNKISDSNSQIATRRSARKRKSNSDHLKVDYSAAENLSTISHNTELIGNDEDKNTLSNTRVADYNRKGRMIHEKEIAYDRVKTSPSIDFITDDSKEESRGDDLQSNSITKTRRSARNMSKNDQSTVVINLDSDFREETIHQDDQFPPKRVRRRNTREKNPGDDKSKVHQFDLEEDSIKISENQNSESEREGNHRTHTLMSKSTNFEISFEEDLSSGSELYEEWMDEYLSSDYENDGKRRACKRKTSTVRKKISVSTELLNNYDSDEEFAGEDYDSQTTKRRTSTRLLEVQSKVTDSDTSHNYDLRKESSCGDPNSDLKRNKRIHKRNLKNDQAENSSIFNENSDYESDVESLSQAHSSEIKSRDGSVKINKPRDDRGSVSRDLDTISNFNKDFLSQELHSDIMSLGTIGDYAVAEDSEINMSVDSEMGRQNTRKEDWENNQMKTLRNVDQLNDYISKESIQEERSPDIKNNTRSLRCRKENCVEDESKITPQLNPVFESDQVLTPAQDELHSDADADELELRDDDMPKEALPHLEDTSNNDADKMKYFTSIFEAGDTVIGDDSIQQLFFMEPKVILRRKKILSCNKCYFLSSSGRLMRKHKLGHFTSKKFNCSACDFTSSTKRALSKHHTEIHKGMVMTIIEDNAYNDKNGNNNNRDDVNSKGNDDNSDEDCDEKDEDNHDYNDNDENCDDKDENNVDYGEKILNRAEENLLKENSFKCTFCDFSTSEVILGKIHLLYHEMANLYFSMKRDFGQEIDESEIDKLFPDDPLLLKYLNIVSQHSVPITCPEYDSKDVSKCANNLDIIEKPQRGVTDFSKGNDIDLNNCKFKGVQNTFDAHESIGKFRKGSNIDEECGILEDADNESSIPPWYDKFPEHNNIRTEHDDNVLAEHDDMSIEHDNNLLTEHMSIEHDNNVLAKHDDNVPTKHDDNKCQESPEKSFVDNNLISDDENQKDLSTEGEINLNYSKIKCTNRFLRKKMYRKSFFKCDFPLSRLKSLSACSTVQGKDKGHSQILTHEKETVAQSDLPLPVRHSTKGQSNKLEMSEDFDFEGQSRYSDFLSTMKVFVAGLISQETSLFNVVNSSNSIPQCSLDLNRVTSVNTNCHDNGVTKQTVTMENIIDGKDISLTQYRGMLSNSRNSDEVTVDIPEGSLSTELPDAPSHSLKESIILREHATHNHSVRRNKSNGNGVTAQSIPPVNNALPYQNAIYDSILNALEASLPLHQRVASEIMNSDQRSTRGARISHINKANREKIHPNQISSVEIGMPRELPQSLSVPPQNSSSMGIMNQSLPLVTEALEQDIRYRTLSFDNAVSNVVSPLYRKQLAVPQCNKYNNGTAGTFSRRPTMIEDPDEALVNQNSTFNKMVSVRGVPFQSDVIMRENNSLNKGDDSMLVIPEKWNINVEIARTPSVYVLNKEMPPNPALVGSNANSDKTTFSSHSEKEPFPSHFKKEANSTQSEIKREIIETRKDFKQASLHELLTLETEKMTRERQTQMELQALLTENYGCSAKESFNATGTPATKSVEQYSLNFVCGDGADLQPSVSPPVLISKDDEDVEYAQKKKNPKKPNIYECDECDYKGAARRYLTAHKLTHQKGRRKFVCSQCSYSTFRQYDLKKHTYTHSAFKKFECCFCDFSTNEKPTMKKHMNTKHAVTEKS